MRAPRCVVARVVIDANVARASGVSGDVVAEHCQETLDVIQSSEHRVVLSEALLAEWERHKSRYASAWLAQMIARRRVEILDVCLCRNTLNACRRVVVSKSKRAAWEKDFHLVCAAMMTDETVLSLDDSARDLFAILARSAVELANVEWINPVTERKFLAEWIRRRNRQKRNYPLSKRMV